MSKPCAGKGRTTSETTIEVPLYYSKELDGIVRDYPSVELATHSMPWRGAIE